MIIYYNKNTGKILATVLGRVHPEEVLKENFIQVQGVDNKDIKKEIFDIEETTEIEKMLQKSQKPLHGFQVILGKKGTFAGLEVKEETLSIERPNSTETIIIDLNQSLTNIKKPLSKETLSYISNKEDLILREVTFDERDKVEKVFEDMEEEKEISIFKLVLRNRSIFLDGHKRMYLLEEKGIPVATAIITNNRDRFTYSLGATNTRGRELKAGYILIWKLIEDAKSLGYSEFDLGGIYEEWVEETKKRVNIFKKKWGGKLVKSS